MRNRKEAERKAKELVSKMTLEEKASQLRYDAPKIKRLGVPGYNYWNEALHGVARAGTATSFPQAIGMAATFDTKLLQKVAETIADEGRAKYNTYAAHEDRDIYKGLTFWSPNVNIFRDPRWGRGHETYGEDPYLTSRLGVAFVKGLQGDGEVMKAAACAKHFAVHSGPEALRHEFNAVATEKDMWETYLPAFEALVKEAEVEAVMGAYNRTNGEPCCGSKTLIQYILREKWKFQGHYVSDCWAIRDFHEYHMVTVNAKESAAMALKAGCDVNCGNTYLHIMAAYQEGLVTEEDITKAAERLFTTRYLLGLFEGSEYDKIGYDKVESKEHLELALETARKSAVLLKNESILPLQKKNLKTIGVIGPNANSRIPLIGNYYGTASRYKTILEGIQDEVGDEVRVFYSEGCHLYKERVEGLAREQDRLSEAEIVAEHSDVVILCVGLDETLEGEEMDTGNNVGSGDKEDLQLPKPQRELIDRVLAVGRPTVVVLMSGSAIDLSAAEKKAAAILQAWYPGAGGGKAIADLLFGVCSPSGKLPVTFYRNLEGMPAFTDYAMTNRTYRYLEQEPLYPFGYGLTYGNVQIAEATILGMPSAKDGILIQAAVENTGAVETDEIVQLYIKDLESEFAVKNHSLCAFERVSVKAGEKKTLKLSVRPEAMTVVDGKGSRFVDSSTFRLYVGISQPDARSVQLIHQKPLEIDIKLDGL